MTAPAASVAVVVATHRRPHLLDRCLQGLAQQRHPADQVVVVVAGRDAATGAVLERWRASLPLQVVAAPGAGPAVARNRGWRLATTDHVAITDDDCRPDAGWLEALIAHAGPRRIVVGRTVVDSLDPPVNSVFDRSFRAGAADAPRFSTSNILYPRSTLEATGGFDEGYTFVGEDTDLGLRALARGDARAYADTAVVHHAVHRRGIIATLRERWRYGTIVHLIRRHPEVRDTLFEGVFWSRPHRSTALALALVGFTSVTPVALLAAAPWLREARHRLEFELPGLPLRSLRGLTQFTGLFALDTVEVVACLWNSLRSRTLFI